MIAWQATSLILASGILFTLSLTSHGAAYTEIRAAAIFADYLHLLAASVWVGGILFLALIIPRVIKVQRELTGSKPGANLSSESASILCPHSHVIVITKFSTPAILSVGILLITGLYSSWAQVASFSGLGTPYGVMLLVKNGIVVPLLLLGAVNLFYIRPRLGRDEKALQLLRKTVTTEAILVVLVLLSVAILVSMEPARQTASRQGIDESGGRIFQKAIDR